MWFLGKDITFEYLIIRILVVMIIIFGVFPLKQYFYSKVAESFGDDTPRITGKLTLNPFAGFDFLGALCLLLFNWGWSKDILINPLNFKNPRRDTFITGITAPITHIVAAAVGGLFLNVAGIINILPVRSFWISFITLYIYMNVMLASMEFLPLRPFKGFQILQVILPGSAVKWYYKNYNMVSIVVCVLLIFGIFSGPLVYIQNIIYNFIIRLTCIA